MPTLTYLKIEIVPANTQLPSGRVASELHIQITTPEEAIEIREIIPDNDFMSRFEWLMDRAKRAALDRLRK